MVEFSAGNDNGKDPDALAGLAAFIPELETHWITTISVREDLQRSGFSSVCGYTKYFCVAAPGTSINSSIVDGDIAGKAAGDTVENLVAGYAEFNGTSMAGPFVTGAFGVLKQRFEYLTNGDINTILKTTATDLGEKGVDATYGWGLINLEKAINGPGQLLGQMNAILPGGRTDTWSNDISQDALNQRKNEDRAEIVGLQTRTAELKSRLVELSPPNRPGEEMIARANSTLQLFKALLSAMARTDFDRDRYIRALNAFNADPSSAELSRIYGVFNDNSNWRSFFVDANAYDTFIAATDTTHLASQLAYPEFYRAWREDNANRQELKIGAKRSELLSRKSDQDYVGSLSKSGDGTLLLTGNNTFNGSTHVSGGALVVNGSILGDAIVDGTGTGLAVRNSRSGITEISELGGRLIVNGQARRVTVGAGGLLGGTGTLGHLLANEGSVVSPGNSIGTLTVSKALGDGSVRFAKGSIFEVEVASDGRSDRLFAEGEATLKGGTVVARAAVGETTFDVVRAAAGKAVSFSILEANEGVIGSFDKVSNTGYALFSGNLSYNQRAVSLSFKQAGFDTLATSGNQKQTARGLESTGIKNAIYNEVLRTKDDQTIAPLFDALSGEIYASTKGYLLSNGTHLTGAATERLRNKSAVGEDQNSLSSNVWGQGFGAWGKVDGNDNTSSYRSNIGGVLAGIDGSPSDNWQAGVLFGYSRSDVKSRFASNNVDSFHVGLYGGADIHGFALRLGGNYSHHEVSTDRRVLDRASLNADYRADALQASAELAYQAAFGSFKIEPFANIAYNYLATGAMSERGNDNYALTGVSGSEILWFTGVGVRATQDIDISAETRVRLNGSALWRYSDGDLAPSGRFAFNGGRSFDNLGAPLARNTAAITAGVGLDLSPTTTLKIDYVGEFSSNTQNHGVKAGLNMKF